MRALAWVSLSCEPENRVKQREILTYFARVYASTNRDKLSDTGLVVLSDASSRSVTRRETYAQLLNEHMEKGYTLVRQWQHDKDRRIQDVLTKLQESLRVCE